MIRFQVKRRCFNQLSPAPQTTSSSAKQMERPCLSQLSPASWRRYQRGQTNRKENWLLAILLLTLIKAKELSFGIIWQNRLEMFLYRSHQSLSHLLPSARFISQETSQSLSQTQCVPTVQTAIANWDQSRVKVYQASYQIARRMSGKEVQESSGSQSLSQSWTKVEAGVMVRNHLILNAPQGQRPRAVEKLNHQKPNTSEEKKSRRSPSNLRRKGIRRWSPLKSRERT